MLVLHRNRGEEIIIQNAHGDIRVMFVDFKGQGVKIGITAERDVRVHRSEVLERIEARAAK